MDASVGEMSHRRMLRFPAGFLWDFLLFLAFVVLDFIHAAKDGLFLGGKTHLDTYAACKCVTSFLFI